MKELGHLKDAEACCAKIYFNNIEEVKNQLLVNKNTSGLTLGVITINGGKNRELKRYLELILPIKIHDHKSHINMESIEGKSTIMIDYELYAKVRKIDPSTNVTKLLSIKRKLENFVDIPWQVTLKRLLKWPSTNMPDGLEVFFPKGWRETGLLSSSGYKVGKSGLQQGIRTSILSKLVERDIMLQGFKGDYLMSWGNTNSLERLLKIARTIAALCRNAKVSTHDFSQAIKDWESDLDFLKEKYFYSFLNLEEIKWPET